jgi:hypothetical protein
VVEVGEIPPASKLMSILDGLRKLWSWITEATAVLSWFAHGCELHQKLKAAVSHGIDLASLWGTSVILFHWGHSRLFSQDSASKYSFWTMPTVMKRMEGIGKLCAAQRLEDAEATSRTR